MDQQTLALLNTLDGRRLLEDIDTLAQIGATGDPGTHRIAYGDSDLAGRDWVDAQMRDLGMSVRRDRIGNTIAAYPGTDSRLAPLATGSHTDTVPNGGKYDGALGVLAGLAAVRTLRDAGIQLRHPLEVINFAAEEASMPGATFGSRAMAGQLTSAILGKPAWDGVPVETVLRRAGIDPDGVVTAARPKGALSAYLELHIEQGGILDKTGVAVGVVEGIVGIRRYAVSFFGYANHAGTTQMGDRSDALVTAAPFILRVREVALRHGIVGTVGSLLVEPNAPNVIPGRVDLTLEIRSLDAAVLDAAEKELADAVTQASGTFAEIVRKSEVMSDPRLTRILTEVSAELGLTSTALASGAGHDAMCVAAIAPEAMIFVPSKGGVSHSPDEYTAPEDCINGARVLLAALLRLDAELDLR